MKLERKKKPKEISLINPFPHNCKIPRSTDPSHLSCVCAMSKLRTVSKKKVDAKLQVSSLKCTSHIYGDVAPLLSNSPLAGVVLVWYLE